MCILANCGNLSVKGELGVQYDTKSFKSDRNEIWLDFSSSRPKYRAYASIGDMTSHIQDGGHDVISRPSACYMYYSEPAQPRAM